MKIFVLIVFACLLSPASRASEERCVPRCESRMLDGSCAFFGGDFCGPGAACVPNCESRFLDGSCAQWGGDSCGLDPYGLAS